MDPLNYITEPHWKKTYTLPESTIYIRTVKGIVSDILQNTITKVLKEYKPLNRNDLQKSRNEYLEKKKYHIQSLKRYIIKNREYSMLPEYISMLDEYAEYDVVYNVPREWEGNSLDIELNRRNGLFIEDSIFKRFKELLNEVSRGKKFNIIREFDSALFYDDGLSDLSSEGGESLCWASGPPEWSDQRSDGDDSDSVYEISDESLCSDQRSSGVENEDSDTDYISSDSQSDNQSVLSDLTLVDVLSSDSSDD